ncbi:MAG: hypothetical protein HY716_02945 [Planctomycetes bacterium]|nr:hypothetical protein [Planctomycetota bacterium]
MPPVKEINGLIYAMLEATLQWDLRKLERSKAELERLGQVALDRVNVLLEDQLRTQAVTLEEAMARYVREARGARFPRNVTEIKSIPWDGEAWCPRTLDDPLVQIWHLSRLEQYLRTQLALRSDQPDLTDRLAVLLWFEQAASRGNWEGAAKCIDTGDPVKARQAFITLLFGLRAEPRRPALLLNAGDADEIR